MYRFLVVVACLFLATVVAGCAPQATPAASPSPLQNEIATEEYEVFAALIKNYFMRDDPVPALLVIKAQTTAGLLLKADDLDRTLAYLGKQLPSLTAETALDFGTRNRQPATLKPFLNLGVPYVFIGQEELSTLFQSNDGWDKFYAKYPRSAGTITLSRVGFNPQSDLALVYMGNQRHWLMGAGYCVLLKKAPEGWSVLEATMAWIS